MNSHFNQVSNGSAVSIRERGPIMQIDVNGDTTDISSELMPLTEMKERTGFLQQLAGLARSLLPDQRAKVTVTTVEMEIFGKLPQAQKPKPFHQPQPIEPVGRKTALRLLKLAYDSGQFGPHCYWHLAEFETEKGGMTTIAMVDHATGLKNRWMICPQTHKLKHLGWINE